MAKKIELTQGMSTIVDDSSYEIMSEKKWYFSHGYARRDEKRDGKRYRIYMHRVLSNAPEGSFVDHINGDKLDNRIENLRIGTNKDNIRNQGKNRKNTTSKYKGVSCKNGKYSARIMVDYKGIGLGTFLSEDDAAMAYNFAALKYFGDFARLNEPLVG